MSATTTAELYGFVPMRAEFSWTPPRCSDHTGQCDGCDRIVDDEALSTVDSYCGDTTQCEECRGHDVLRPCAGNCGVWVSPEYGDCCWRCFCIRRDTVAFLNQALGGA